MNRFALISVTDKSDLAPFAKGLSALGYTILSTGGTAAHLKEYGVPIIEVAEFTQSPEILDGRVKTLHPKIHGGILFDRNNPNHVAQAAKHGIEPLSIVVVNLYEFAKETARQALALDKAIEHIDIGGPTMLRAAAKNYQHCAPVIDPKDYPALLAELQNQGELSLSTRRALAQKTFAAISAYDHAIAKFFARQSGEETFPQKLSLQYEQVEKLRYGENPHQEAAVYKFSEGPSLGLFSAAVLQGKQLSYNNYLDLDAAVALVEEFTGTTTVAIIKHTNPCGIACSTKRTLDQVYAAAQACDPKSAFGGIIAANAEIDAETAKLMVQTFYECIVAPSFSEDALEIFKTKKDLRLVKLAFAPLKSHSMPGTRSIKGGLLVQMQEPPLTQTPNWQRVSKQSLSTAQMEDLEFAMRVVKHVKSNAIVYAKDGRTLGIGAGQMSRIDAAKFGAAKAQEAGHSLTDAVMSSDAFFPFRDCVDYAASLGVAAIIQPGGSKKDQESIDACDEHKIAMVLTKSRHFKH